MIVTKGYGFSISDIDESCPADLEPYNKAYKLEQKTNDSLVYAWFGEYFRSALGAMFDSKEKYAEKPILSREMDQYDIQQEREAFMQKLDIIGRNFRLSQKQNGSGKV